MNFGNIVIMMNKFGSKSGDFAQREQIVYPTPVINGKTYTIINEDFNFTDFKIFALKAFDKYGIKRLDDTELKYVFHFLDENWDKGNRFVIRIESTLYNCTSCMRYMEALQEIGKDAGKTIEIEFVAHPKMKSITDIKNIK